MRKVESIAELNRICQKPDYRKEGNWMERYVLRDVAIYVTWLLLHTSLSANHLTAFLYVLVFVACLLISVSNPIVSFVGVVLVQVWYLLDQSDGQIARYRKSTSLEGAFADFMMHHAVDLIVPFAVGWSVFERTSDKIGLLSGFVAGASLLMLGLFVDARSKIYWKRLNETGGVVQPVVRVKSAVVERKHLFFWLHKSCETYFFLLVLTVLATVDLMSNGFRVNGVDARMIFLIYYATSATLVWTAKLYYQVKRRRVTEEFLNRVEKRLAS